MNKPQLVKTLADAFNDPRPHCLPSAKEVAEAEASGRKLKACHRIVDFGETRCPVVLLDQ
jgi:hypothetical protein